MKIILTNSKLVFRTKEILIAKYYNNKVASWGGNVGIINNNNNYAIAVSKIPEGVKNFSMQGFSFNSEAAACYLFYSQDPTSVEDASTVYLGKSSYIPDIANYGGKYIAINTTNDVSPESITFKTDYGDIIATFES